MSEDTKIILRISGLPKVNLLRHLFWKIFANRIYKVTCQQNLLTITYEKKFLEEKMEVLCDPIIDLKEYRLKKLKNLILKN